MFLSHQISRGPVAVTISVAQHTGDMRTLYAQFASVPARSFVARLQRTREFATPPMHLESPCTAISK